MDINALDWVHRDVVINITGLNDTVADLMYDIGMLPEPILTYCQMYPRNDSMYHGYKCPWLSLEGNR